MNPATRHFKAEPQRRSGEFCFPNSAPLLLCGFILLLAAVTLRGQAPLSDLLFTVGTTIRGGGNDFSYVLIGSGDPALLRGKQFAVFAKAGPASSANTFTLRGNIAQQNNPVAITTLLNQSVVLGQDLTSLGQTLNGLLRREPGITNQSLGQKVATLFRVANTNADATALVAVLAVQNPGLKLALGQAFTEVITSETTYEMRELNPANGTPGDVVGRVTISPGAPVILPAPGRPFQVMTNHPDDDLAIRLRWGTPVELRRLSLLSYGFNVWRIPRAPAESAAFHLTPPTPAQLLSNPNFRRVNDAPAAATKEFSAGAGPGAADDPTDRTTYFFSDNNNRLKRGGVPFADGEEFYFFVTARDILGRDGLVSPGRLSIACRRLPPLAPTDPSVRDEVQVRPTGGFTTNEQRLRVVWKQNTNVADRVTEYWVYRWPNPTMVFSNDYVPLNNRIGVVTHLSATNQNSYLDDGTGAPRTPGLSNFWYTVRAVSVAACDPLLSPHCPPASGVLRVREGPAATTNATLVGSCGSAVVVYSNLSVVADASLPAARSHYRFSCERTDPGIAWVTFVVSNSVPANEAFGPIYFPADGNVVEIDYSAQEFDAFQLSVTCTVGTSYGQVSKPVTRVLGTVPDRQRWIVRFMAGQVLFTAPDTSGPYIAALNFGQLNCVPALDVTPDSNGIVTMRFNIAPVPVLVQAQTNVPGQWTDVGIAVPDANGIYEVSYPACLVGPLPPFRGCVVNLPAAEDCVQHVAYGRVGGRIAPIQIKFGLTPRTREYRLYRQVNDGPLTLMSQGAAIYNALLPNRRVIRHDETMPVSAGRICYYVQLLDEHGNPSPMAFIGCKDVTPPQLPVPVLAEPAPAGNTSQPQVSLNWFCPTAGIHRFKVFVERIDQPDKPAGISGVSLATSALIPKGTYFATTLKNALLPIRFSEFYFTKPVGTGFGPGPQFTMNVNVEANVAYRIAISAVDARGSTGAVSQAWEFTWNPPAQRQIVNWPFRDLPPVDVFHPGIQARLMTNEIDFNQGIFAFSRDYPVGVRIGAVDSYDGYPAVSTYRTRPLVILGNVEDAPKLDPNYHVFRRAGGKETLLPIALYRQQVTNASFPRVSGDVTQVSPLIEKIAYRITPDVGNRYYEVVDKLIARSGESEGSIPGHPNKPSALGTYGIYLLDAQPVTSGATYRYFVARFKDNRELDMIIPAGEVTIP